MKNNHILGLTDTLLLFLIGCTSVKYTAPMVIVMPPGSFTQAIDKSFDSTWSAVIQYIGTSPFNIDNFEKASGLLTLSFTSTNPAELVSVGYWELRGHTNFSGDYVDYLVQTPTLFCKER